MVPVSSAWTVAVAAVVRVMEGHFRNADYCFSGVYAIVCLVIAVFAVHICYCHIQLV